MEKIEIYSLLFADSFHSNFAISTAKELAFHSMKIFAIYQPYLVIMIAFSASLLAFSCNYLFGHICYKILRPVNSKEEQKATEKRLESVRSLSFLPAILALSFVPFCGKFVPVFAGFCKISFIRTMVISLLAKLIYYYLAYYFF